MSFVSQPEVFLNCIIHEDAPTQSAHVIFFLIAIIHHIFPSPPGYLRTRNIANLLSPTKTSLRHAQCSSRLVSNDEDIPETREGCNNKVGYEESMCQTTINGTYG